VREVISLARHALDEVRSIPIASCRAGAIKVDNLAASWARIGGAKYMAVVVRRRSTGADRGVLASQAAAEACGLSGKKARTRALRSDTTDAVRASTARVAGVAGVAA
jgi:hypothetical protein